MIEINNGLIINGKAIELSKEQVTAIAEAFANPEQDKNISLEKDNTNEMAVEFTYNKNSDFYYIGGLCVEKEKSSETVLANSFVERGNYCHNEDVMIYRMHRETLARLIWRFAMEHNKTTLAPKDNPTICDSFTDVQFMQPDCWNDKIPKEKVSIEYFMDDKVFGLSYRGVEDMSFDVTTTYFDDEVVATRCINEVIIPYIEEHGYWFPEYKGCKQIEEYLKNKIP